MNTQQTEEAKKKMVTLRITESEWEFLDKYCKLSGRSKNDILRELIRELRKRTD